MTLQRVSHYLLLDRIGEGGMGEVYRARDERLGRTLAVKTLRRDSGADQDMRRRLVQEAQAVSALNHPNIVTVYDIGREEDSGRDFIAMEYVEGESLAQLLGRGEHGVELALRIGRPVASALAAAHDAGIIHRDLKPANVMITAAGGVKLLDFGLAKLTRLADGDQGVTTPAMDLTGEGLALGTPSYMAPEQVEGRTADARSDVFALGLLLYELLTGKRAFSAGSAVAVMGAILRDPAPSVTAACPDCPTALAQLLARCLEKAPERRPRNASEVHAALARIATDWQRGRTLAGRLRRPRVWLPWLALAMLVAAIYLVSVQRERAAQAAFESEIAGLSALVADERLVEAFVQLRQIEHRYPEHPQLAAWWNDLTLPGQRQSVPEGARVWIKPYTAPDAEWVDLGLTGPDSVPMPLAHARWRLHKEGYEPLELSSPGYFIPQVPLTPVGEVPPGMLKVPGGPFRYGWMPPAVLDPFWLGRTEVTQAEYQRFVDAGGYRERRFWQEAITVDGRELEFEEAMALFVDGSGRPGPAGWLLGRYPQGQAEHPVAGISWYEAMAYARFAGGSLPSAHHWMAAAAHNNHSDVVDFANFDGEGSVPVASRDALSPYGHHDLAGNVAEWTATASGEHRLALGGDFASPTYVFTDLYPERPLTRSPRIGMRLARFDGTMDPALRALETMGAPELPEPVSDEVFETFRRLYGYDPVSLAPTLESSEEGDEWRLELWRVPAAYDGDSFRVKLYLPRRAQPPFQTVIYGPHSGAMLVSDSLRAGTREFAFLLRSGRAVAFPVFYGTFERRLPPDAGERARLITRAHWTRDAGRTLDLIETHPELDAERVGWFSNSLGSNVGINVLAVESRFRAAVLTATGLYGVPMPAENDPVNFLPRVRLPVLLVGGREDFFNPVATSQRPLFERLGTPPEDKAHYLFEGGHVAPRTEALVGVIVDWFDRHLGAVDSGRSPGH